MIETELLEAITRQISRAQGKAFNIRQVQQVFGGDINHTFTISDGVQKFFVKVNTGKPSDFFEKEAMGLQLLQQASSSLKIPQPIAYGSSGSDLFLILEWLERASATAGFYERLGMGLAALHRNSAGFFGLGYNNYLGTQVQENTPCTSWPEFYGTYRLMPFARIAHEHGLLGADDITRVEHLCNRLGNIFPDEPASLLHGDLWNGNYACVAGNLPAVFDPAVYYGCREMDIAMTLLFGGFERPFYLAYNEAWPLKEGWLERVGICQLYPLLMHLNHFGNSYYAAVRKVLEPF